MTSPQLPRRRFLQQAGLLAGGLIALPQLSHAAPAAPAPPDLFTIGPQPGYAPHIGVLVSMLTYNRQTIINAIKDLSVEQLDYLHDAKSNTIGALALHLAAVEKFYQINTFEGRQDFNADEKKIWGASMSLGKEGREKIKGQPASYYLDRLKEVRELTLATLKTKDDTWLLAVDPAWSNERQGKLNTYWKWFHVCEHESNHRGQISWLKGRMPGAKESSD